MPDAPLTSCSLQGEAEEGVSWPPGPAGPTEPTVRFLPMLITRARARENSYRGFFLSSALQSGLSAHSCAGTLSWSPGARCL